MSIMRSDGVLTTFLYKQHLDKLLRRHEQDNLAFFAVYRISLDVGGFIRGAVLGA